MKCKVVLRDLLGKLVLRCDKDDSVFHEYHFDVIHNAEWRQPFTGVPSTKMINIPPKIYIYRCNPEEDQVECVAL